MELTQGFRRGAKKAEERLEYEKVVKLLIEVGVIMMVVVAPQRVPIGMMETSIGGREAIKGQLVGA
jgi:hypothetical protein